MTLFSLPPRRYRRPPLLSYADGRNGGSADCSDQTREDAIISPKQYESFFSRAALRILSPLII